MKKLLHGEEEWLKARQGVITATEAPSLLGLNPYLTPSQMAQEKVQRTFHGNGYTLVGQFLEEIVVKATNKKLGTSFQIIENDLGKVFYKHPELALGATPDAVDDNVFLECKTTKPLNYLKYKYSPPANYLMQLQTQMFCAGHNTGYLAIMSTDLSIPDYETGQKSEEDYLQSEFPLSIVKVEWNKRLCDLLSQEVIRFWDCHKREKMFRVSSKVKKEALFLIQMCYERVK